MRRVDASDSHQKPFRLPACPSAPAPGYRPSPVTSAKQPPNGLPMTVSVEGDQLVIALSGEIDISNAEGLPAALLAATNGDPKVVIDIADVTFLDSSGLRAILMCEASLSRSDVVLKVRNPSPQARHVFEITQLVHLLEA